jgi:hypothetical protein
MIETLLTNLGLSGSAGLNAYLPPLILGAMHHADLITLQEPYDTLAAYPVIAVLAVLLLIEMVVDKLPAIDSANDIIQSFVRPTSGAIVSLVNASGQNSQVDPTALAVITILSGGAAAFGVHAMKATIRPGVTLTTGGLGNMVVSFLEDVVSVTVSLFAILLPVIIPVFMASTIAIAGWWWWDMRRVKTYFGQKAKRKREEALLG